MTSSRCFALRFSAISLAILFSETALKVSPAAGTSVKPMTSTAVAGSAFRMVSPK